MIGVEIHNLKGQVRTADDRRGNIDSRNAPGIIGPARECGSGVDLGPRNFLSQPVYCRRQQVGFNVTAFLAGLGIVGFTIGFALQDVSKNFISGLLLLVQQPFNIGETIEVTGFTGTVVAIDMRATEVHTADGRVVLIPNASVFTNPITNHSRTGARRVDLVLKVTSDNDLEAVREAVLQASSSVPGLSEQPPPVVNFSTIEFHTVELQVYYWIDTNQTDLLLARDAGLTAIKRALDQAGIEMA